MDEVVRKVIERTAFDEKTALFERSLVLKSTLESSVTLPTSGGATISIKGALAKKSRYAPPPTAKTIKIATIILKRLLFDSSWKANAMFIVDNMCRLLSDIRMDHYSNRHFVSELIEHP